jgi:hypothetical protein
MDSNRVRERCGGLEGMVRTVRLGRGGESRRIYLYGRAGCEDCTARDTRRVPPSYTQQAARLRCCDGHV